MERIDIDFGAAAPADGPDPADEATFIEYVGGSRGGRVETVYGHTPPQIMIVAGPGGPERYRRSVRCADDERLRYVLEPDD